MARLKIISAKASGLALSSTLLVYLGLAPTPIEAQVAPCGISSIISWNPALYPPIAKAARVSGPVIMLMQFDRDGLPVHTSVVSGPIMLRKAATDSVSSIRVNSFTGVRECPIVIHFKIGDCDQPVLKSALPSSTVCAESIVLSDPAFTITKRRRFILF